MERVTRWRKRSLSLVAAVTLLLASVAVAPRAEAAEEAEQWTEGLKPDQLPELAESGEFDRLLMWLKREYAGSDHGAITSLIEDLDRFSQHRDEDADRRRAAYEEALDEAVEAFDAERIEDALVAAIEAHGLADDPKAMLNEPMVRELVERAEAGAAEAADESRWVDALSLYRLLDLLYEDQGKYREQIDETSRHVRVLRIYAPETLRELQQARTERREAARGEEAATDAEEAVELPSVEIEPWDEQVDDVGLGMLRQVLQQSAVQHIGSEGYAPLLRGAVDALLVFVRTEAIGDTFPAFGNQPNHQRFLEHLEQLSAQLEPDERGQGGDRMGYLRAATIIDQIMSMNERTLDLPERVLIYEMAEGATAVLDDFSSVIWPQQTQTFTRSTRGKFFGVGIQLSRRDGRLVVVSPLLNTPAQQAGIKAGDVIAEVDGQDTSTWSLDKAVREITGPKGTVVTLGIERRGEPELIDYEIERAEIEIESIRGWEHTRNGDWDYFIDRDSRIGYVRLTQFIPQTADDLDAAIEKLQETGPINGLILDLRHNPGGLLSSAIDVADRFIDEGPLVFTVNAEGEHTDERRAQRHRTYQPFPMVTLVNEGSASGSEIVAGALQDHGRSLVVGTRSFGKGSVQDLFPLERGRAYLKLTTQHYMLPQGRIIDRQPQEDLWGIEPNLTVEMTDRQVADAIELRQEIDVLRDPDDEQMQASRILEEGLDPQLEAALLVLKARLAARQIAMNELPDEHRAAAHHRE